MQQALTRREFAALLAAGAVAAAHAVRGETGEDAFFPFGAHVYREPHRGLDELRADMALLRRLGFTMVKVQESWAADESREGVVVLDDVERVVSDARQLGLRVFFGVTMEQAPGWLWRKYPDADVVYDTGQRHEDPTQYLLPSDGKPGPCWHHPGAREAASSFIRQLGRRLARFDNILVWNVWQEIGHYPWAMRPGGMWLCYCAHSLAAYRAWLRHRYGGLDRLNETWLTQYGEWEEIVPPRWYRQVPATIDWRYFVDVVSVSEAARFKAEAFRAVDPLRRPVMAHANSPLVGSTRDWSFAQAVDVYGTSSYPDWGGSFWRTLPLSFEYARSASAGKPFWVAELQGGPIAEGLNLRRTPTATDIRRYVLAGLASGAQGICFWNHRAEIMWGEGYGFGLLDSTGDSTPRAEEAGRLARAIGRHADLFAQGKPPEPRVAILVNEDLWHFAEASGPEVKDQLANSVAGHFKALWDERIPVRFLSAEAFLAGAGGLDALILPFPLALSNELSLALHLFVAAGGHLVSEACPGRFSDHGLGTAGEMPPLLAELFGARHDSLARLREPGERIVRDPDAPRSLDGVEWHELSGTGELEGFTISPSVYLQTLRLTTGKAVLRTENAVAGCVNELGRGRAWLFGTILGHAPALRDDARAGRVLARVLSGAGIAPETNGRLVRRRRVLGNRAAWFLFNDTDTAIEESLALGEYSKVVDLLDLPLVSGQGTVRVSVEPRQVRCLILSA